MTFDQATADRLIAEIGQLVLDSEFSDMPWETAVLIADLDNRKSMFGYCFWGEDEWEAATPAGFEALQLFVQLREATKVPDVGTWRRAKLTVDRASRRVNFEFDYEGDKWKPDYADPGGFARSLLLAE